LVDDKTNLVYQNVSRDSVDGVGKTWIRRAMASTVHHKQAPDFHIWQSCLLILSADSCDGS